MTDKINEECEECNHFEEHPEFEKRYKFVCGFAISLGHSQDAQSWIIDGQKCPYYNLSIKACNDIYFGGL